MEENERKPGVHADPSFLPQLGAETAMSQIETKKIQTKLMKFLWKLEKETTEPNTTKDTDQMNKCKKEKHD